MVQLTVYGNKMATCTQRILILLEELELKYEIKNVDLVQQEQKSDEFLALNPFGKVPVVIYDDQTMFESRSILRYIAKNNTEFLDLTLNDSFEVDMWLEVESQSFNPLVSTIVNEKLFKKWKEEETDESLVEKTLEQLDNILSIYEKRLSEHKYIGGDSFSIADISHFPYLNYFLKCDKTYKVWLKRYPRVYKWFKRMSLRESIKNVLV